MRWPIARTLPGIDPNRIGLWGTSFSGGHVIATAARLPGIAAVVSQCPFTDSVASLGAVDPLISARLTALGGPRPDHRPLRRDAGDGADRRASGRGRADDRPGRLPRLSGSGARRRRDAQRGRRADRREAAALPAGSARGEGALPDPVLHLRNRHGRAVRSDPPLCGDGAPRRDQALSGRAFRDLRRRRLRAGRSPTNWTSSSRESARRPSG